MEWLALILALLGIAVAIFVPLAIEYYKRPKLKIAHAADANRIEPTAFRIVHVRVANLPITGILRRWIVRSAATGCRVQIELRSTSDWAVRPAFAGKWSSRAEPIQYLPKDGLPVAAYDPGRWPEGLVLDVVPGGHGEVVAVAIKHEGDAEAYAFDPSAIYQDPVGLRNYSVRLTDTEYEVTVVATSGEITAEQSFILRNDGTRYTGLELRPA